jgi:hypothetical protein
MCDKRLLKRYEATLGKVVQQISENGMLAHDTAEISKVTKLSNRKRNLALWAFFFAILVTILFEFD